MFLVGNLKHTFYNNNLTKYIILKYKMLYYICIEF